MAVTEFVVLLPPRSEDDYPRLRRIEVFTPMYYERIERRSMRNKGIILFFAKAIAENANHILDRWLRLHGEIRDILDLFFGIHYDQSMFPTNRFLNVVQALVELFYR